MHKLIPVSKSIVLTEGLLKKDKYEALLPQLVALTEGETDSIANIANIVAALKESFSFFWIGVYFVKQNGPLEELVLGPFQGPVACVRIAKGKGVCGTAWEKKETIVFDDVDQFPGHIACSALSKSEIVVPIIKKNNVLAVLDIDSMKKSDFDSVDSEYLNRIAVHISKLL